MSTKISAEELAQKLVPGDILCTSFPGSSLLADGIRIGQSLAGGETAIFGHAMRFVGAGLVISQEWRVALKPLSAWSGQVVCRLHNPRYGQEERDQLVWLAKRAEGRLYDILGLVGQGLRGLLSRIPWGGQYLGNGAADLIQVPWLTYCSEMVAEHQRRVDPGFMPDIPKPAPDEMMKWCKGEGWIVEVYEVEMYGVCGDRA